ncbi:hypothetical protein G5V58_16550 [Nocardioides anomalus]|uniref:Uncharacterized protein n=1 Tax=Nocardioides anomalus TaxID=2712223 RepID=A0A6G6WG84_9ACTN|nr:hypothetical protein [Nocardioides anomalus]QIG44167.1 hypothetical protein G5V58_16550 [Nocardioides anomalus]
MGMIGNRLPLTDVMSRLAYARPVFHSEADFQFAFAQTVWSMDPDIKLRLEVPARNPLTRRAEYIDLVCIGDSVTRVEFKYATRKWEGTDGITDELFLLRDHAAMDLARHGFVHDVFRLERLTADGDSNGLAIMLTNSPSLWNPGAATSRDAAFRIDEGRTLTGELSWGTPDSPYPKNDRTLGGRYTAHWRDFSTPVGSEFRWLGWTITSPAS